MVQGIQALVDLSRIDAQIAELEEERTGLPAARDALAKERERGRSAVDAAEASLQEAEQEQRRHEAVLADKEALVAKLEGQQFQVKTNDAYTALLHEIEAARGAISEAETRILEAMEAIEAARAGLERARSGAQAAEQRVAGEERALDDREKSLAQSLGNLQRARAAAAEGLDAALTARYEKIATRRRPAVAVARNETCMGCRVSLPPQLLLEMRKGETLITCGNCQRILVLEDAR
jgi:hypothetical protein